jgi:hypothetical protein
MNEIKFKISKAQQNTAKPDQKTLNVTRLIRNMTIQNTMAIIWENQNGMTLILAVSRVYEHPKKHHFD